MKREAMMPSYSGRVGRLLLSAVLAFALGLGAAIGASPGSAWADDKTYGNGSITITMQGNTNATYDVYRLFVADITVTNGTEDIATYVKWSSDAVETAVKPFLNRSNPTNGADKTYDDWRSEQGTLPDTAQNAALYISTYMSASATAAGTSNAADRPIKEGNSFATLFAQYMKASGSAAIAPGDGKGTARTGTTYENTEGYYLFVSTTSTIENASGPDSASTPVTGDVGTAPLWIALGGHINAINAKESSPTVTFLATDDRASATWGKAVDANVDQDLDYQIQGTLPSNINAFSTYHDQYVVTLPSGMELALGSGSTADMSSLNVKLGDTALVTSGTIGGGYTGELTTTYSNNVLTVDIPDVRKVSGSANSQIIEITFRAHNTNTCMMGSTGNAVHLERTYSDDPAAPSSTKTLTPVDIRSYAYQIDLTKVDKQDKQLLSGAKFTVQVADGTTSVNGNVYANSDTAYSAGKYVQADGSLGTTPHEFMTGNGGNSTTKGVLNIPRIDEGTYIIHETDAPNGYNLETNDIVITLTSTLDADTSDYTSMARTFTGGNQVKTTAADEVARLGDLTITSDGTTEEPSGNVGAWSAASGKLLVLAVDDRAFQLFNTGLEGTGALYAIAAALALAGAAAIAIALRRRDGRE